jgi:hypothetical protein
MMRRFGGIAKEAKMVVLLSLKLTVRARVLEMGHGAWRHEMGMVDGDRKAYSAVLPGARALGL